MKFSPFPWLVAFAALPAFMSLLACGSAASGPPPAANGVDGGSADASVTLDAAVPPADGAARADAPSDSPGDGSSATYPAFVPDVPTLTNLGGAILSAPKIVTIVWTADANHTKYEAFDDAIGASDYWKAAVREYGVGPATNGGHVEIATPPPVSFAVDPANDEIDAFIVNGVEGAPGNGWPLPDAQTMYMLFIPESVAILQGGTDACANTIGYHAETTAGAHAHVVYGVVAEKCHDTTATVIDSTTETASHEIGEAATDPHTDTDGALSGFDADHYVWELFQQGQDENGDACEFFDDSYYQDTPLDALVQRLWSNKAVLAGKNPCVPGALGVAYFNVTPLAQEMVDTLDAASKKHHSKGFHVPIGSMKTVDFGAYNRRADGRMDNRGQGRGWLLRPGNQAPHADV